MKETITLNTQEQKRVLVLPRLVVGQLTAAEAAVLLSLSERQVRRLCAAYRIERKVLQRWPMGIEAGSQYRVSVRRCDAR